MPWTRLNPVTVVQQLRAEHGPSDEDAAEQALAHLREALLNGVIVVQDEVAEARRQPQTAKRAQIAARFRWFRHVCRWAAC